ncbi:hypothetical protein [Streptomyces rochei]|uniref:hypothetical protein n=1 Tax=Streptomyces rochei TaxID=1928 RepID=UPI0033A2EC9F
MDAERILNRRLRRRIADQGETPVLDPVGWLIGRALPRRSMCPDLRCDDGHRMDTGADCEACLLLHSDRRALRHRAAVKVAARLGISAKSQLPRRDVEAEMRHQWERLGWIKAAEQERDAEVRRAREEAQARRKAELQAQEEARLERPCQECGRARAAGLCGVCADARRVEELVAEAVDIEVAAWGDPEVDGLERFAEQAGARVRAEVEQSRRRGLEQGAFEETVSLMGKLAAELAVAEVQRRALGHLAWTDEARAEAESAYAAQMRRRYLFDTRAEAEEAAREAGRAARWRTAEYLLRTRLGTLRAQRAQGRDERVRSPYSLQADRVRAQLGTSRADMPTPASNDRGVKCDGMGGQPAAVFTEDPYIAGAARARAALAAVRG